MRLRLHWLAVFVLSGSVVAQPSDSTTFTHVGQKVPAFSVTTLDGKIIDAEAMAGKVVLLNFFATWCPPCNQEFPELETRLWKKHRDQGLLVLAIGREHDAKELLSFRKKKGATFPLAPDPKRAVYGKFAAQTIPRNVLVDRHGTIVYQSIGYTPEEFSRLADRVESALANP